MDEQLQAEFLTLWNRYFPGAELPVTLFYSETAGAVDKAPPSDTHRCMICDLAKVRKGDALCFDLEGAVCGGAKRYLGFSQDVAPGFEFFSILRHPRQA